MRTLCLIFSSTTFLSTCENTKDAGPESCEEGFERVDADLNVLPAPAPATIQRVIVAGSRVYLLPLSRGMILTAHLAPVAGSIYAPVSTSLSGIGPDEQAPEVVDRRIDSGVLFVLLRTTRGPNCNTAGNVSRILALDPDTLAPVDDGALELIELRAGQSLGIVFNETAAGDKDIRSVFRVGANIFASVASDGFSARSLLQLHPSSDGLWTSTATGIGFPGYGGASFGAGNEIWVIATDWSGSVVERFNASTFVSIGTLDPVDHGVQHAVVTRRDGDCW